MTKKNNGSGKLRAGFDNFVRNMCQKYSMSEETFLNVLEQMIAKKRKEKTDENR